VPFAEGDPKIRVAPQVFLGAARTKRIKLAHTRVARMEHDVLPHPLFRTPPTQGIGARGARRDSIISRPMSARAGAWASVSLIRASGHCIPIHDVGLAALSEDKSSGASVGLHAIAVRSGDCICKGQKLSGRSGRDAANAALASSPQSPSRPHSRRRGARTEDWTKSKQTHVRPAAPAPAPASSCLARRPRAYQTFRVCCSAPPLSRPSTCTRA
jgi:hypothetical protein